jgi:hypothetical protein
MNGGLGKEESEANEKDPSDYYFEDGLLVFTETHHLKRGYCCQNGCRHCPYGFKKEKKDS